MRQNMLAANGIKRQGPAAMAKRVFKGVGLKDLAPEVPAISNFTTGEIMGHSSDRLAAKFGVSRADQDLLAFNSHTNAAKAHAEGKYKGEIVAVDGSEVEGGINAEVSLEKLNSLKPAFIKPHGTHTAGNSSFLSDGASACLIMDEQTALDMGFEPLAFIKGWEFAGVDPFEEMLLGPAYATSKVLQSAGLKLQDIDVLEIHEAFAGQVLANIAAMESDSFGKSNLGRDGACGTLDHSKLNQWGGSLAIGHPFGATGARIVTTAANRLREGGGRYALTTACADSGLANATLLERYEPTIKK
jgi:acetyl-CoA acyltransferase